MFVGLFLPRFLLQSALRWREISGSAVVVDEAELKGFVLEANEAATRHGIVPGMSSAQAMARDLRVQLLPRAPRQEECVSDFLIETALTLSADAELTSSGLAVADLRRRPSPPCWQAFGDELRERFAREQLEVRVGIASTPDLAILAAKGAREVSIVYDASAFGGDLPIAALEPSPELHQRLADWGIGQVRGLLALPAAELTERLGPEAGQLLRKVSGRHQRVLTLVRPVASYTEAFDFEHEVETSEPLLFLLRRFLETLTARIRAVHRVVERMTLTLPLENRTMYERRFAIPAPTTEIEVLYRILDTHLETVQLAQRPVSLRLELHVSTPQKNQLGLFETALRDLNGFGETLARLKALLGDDHVGVPKRCDTHRPDSFALSLAFADQPATPEPLTRGWPLRRYRPPMPARLLRERGAFVHLHSAQVQGAIARQAGPFRLTGNWWDRAFWQSEEWDVELADGGIYRVAHAGGQWRLEGSYDELR